MSTTADPTAGSTAGSTAGPTTQELKDLIEKLISDKESIKVYIDTHLMPRIEAIEKRKEGSSLRTGGSKRVSFPPKDKDMSATKSVSLQNQPSFVATVDKDCTVTAPNDNSTPLLLSGDEENLIAEDMQDDDDGLHFDGDTKLLNSHELSTEVNTDPNSKKNTKKKDTVEVSLTKDSYSMMMVSKLFSIYWWFSLIFFALQFTLFSMILYEQFNSNYNDNLFNLPASVGPTVLTGQFLATLVLFTTQDDIIDSIMICIMFFEHKEGGGRSLNSDNINSFIIPSKAFERERSVNFTRDLKAYWRANRFQVILPNTLKLIQGLLALTTSFIIVITSESLIDLFKDFTALSMISYVDNVFFKLCQDGIFGFQFVQKTEEVEMVKLKRRKLKKGQVPMQTFIFGFLVLAVYTVWGIIAYKQGSGDFFRTVYPDCQLKNYSYLSVGDGECNKWANTIECGFDGGDCNDFNEAYPSCEAGDPDKLLDPTVCNNGLNDFSQIYLTAECGYDNGACCESLFVDGAILDKSKLGNGICNEYPYNSPECQYDGGDCAPKYSACNVSNPLLIGNGQCNYDQPGYNTKECGWDDGDCFIEGYPDCHTDSGDDPNFIGDGTCNEKYNTEACGYDAGDCCFATVGYEDTLLLGNGVCDAQFNIPQCLYDKGDCIVPNLPDCHVDEPRRIGDSRCDGGEYNTEICNYDNGDCKVPGLPDCITNHPLKIGNGVCEDFDGRSDSNTKECNYEGGDCDQVELSNGIVNLTVTSGGLTSHNDFDGFRISARQLSNDNDLWLEVDSSSMIKSSHAIQIDPLESNRVYAKTSIVIGDRTKMRISQIIEPSDRSSYLYKSTITLENLSDEILTDLRYKRTIKWNTPESTNGKECALILFNSIQESSSDPEISDYDESFGGPVPFLEESSLIEDFSCAYDFDACEIKIIDKDHNTNGHLLQFKLEDDGGLLSPWESVSFEIFYGVAIDKENSYTISSSVGAEIVLNGYSSFGSECSIEYHDPYQPEIFMLGFRGIGGKPLVPPNLSVKYYASSVVPLSAYEVESLAPYKFGMVPKTHYVDTASNGLFTSSEMSSAIVALFEGYLNFSANNTIYDICLMDHYTSYYPQSSLYLDGDKIIGEDQRCAQRSLEGVKKVSIETSGKVELYWRKSASLVHLPSSEWLKTARVNLHYYTIGQEEQSRMTSLAQLAPYNSKMIDTMDVLPLSDVSHDDGLTAISLEGFLNVNIGLTYTFCLSSNDRAKLYINDKMKIIIDDDQIERIKCKEVTAFQKVLKVSVDVFGTKGYTHYPFVLRWIIPNELLSIIPSNAWIEDNSIHEAETTDIQSAYFLTEQIGYSGPGYVLLSDTDSFVEWNIAISDPHTLYGIQFRYQNSEKAQLELFIDGSWRKSIDFQSSTSNYWVDTEAFLVPLSYGNHSIRLNTRHVGGQSIDFVRVDEALDYGTYTGMSSCNDHNPISRYDCSSSVAEYMSLPFGGVRSDAYQFFTSMDAKDHYIPGEFHIRNVGTNKFIEVGSECESVSVQPFKASDSQKFSIRRIAGSAYLQNIKCNKVLTLHNDCHDLVLGDFRDDVTKPFEVLNGKMKTSACENDKLVTADGNSGNTLLYMDNVVEGNLNQQWIIEQIDETIPCGCVLDKNKKNLFYNPNTNCAISSLLPDYDLICNPPLKSCNTFRFITATDDENASSESSFEIDGFGALPSSCHDKLGAECEVTLCGINYFDLYARGADDDWRFTIDGDIGGLLDHHGGTPTYDKAIESFPTWMSSISSDSWQRYSMEHLNYVDVMIDVVTDDDTYQLIRWKIFDHIAEKLIAATSHGHYSEQNTYYSHRYFLSSQSCFVFEIDGIDSLQFPAGYNVTFDGIIYASSYLDGLRTSSVRFGKNCEPTTSPTELPSLLSSTFDITRFQCEESEVNVIISIFTDDYPSETSWELMDIESGEILFSESSYERTNSEYKHQVCVPLGSCTIFSILDGYGDGISDSGGYKVSVDDKIVVDTYGSGSFDGCEDSIRFGDGCPPTLEPTISPSINCGNGFTRSGIINGICCENTIIVSLDCSDEFLEGTICANDGKDNQAYCSYDIGPKVCAYCDRIAPTSTPTKSLSPSITEMPSISPTASNSVTSSPSLRHIPSQYPTEKPSISRSTMAPTFSSCEENEITVRIRVVTDDYPDETSWELNDPKSGAMLKSVVSGYTDSNHEHNHQICLPVGSCFTFKISDSMNDGIKTPGGYEVTVDGTIVSSTFTSIDGNIAVFDDKENIAQFGCIPTIKPTTSPTSSPSYSPCKESEITVIITIQTDDHPDEILWRLIDAETGTLLIQSSEYTKQMHSYHHQQCLPASSCNIFTIHDLFGDGIISPGGYEVSVDDIIVASSLGSNAPFSSYDNFIRFGNRCAQ